MPRPQPSRPAPSTASPRSPRSRLAARLEARAFVVTTELNPPKGIELGPLLERAEGLAAWVDAFNLTDSHLARMSMSPVAAAHHLLQRGLEPIVQLTTRDRNRIALQAEILGAAALGVRNVVLMGGDAPGSGDHPEAKPVFDVSTEVLLAAAHGLADGVDLSGNPLRGAPALLIGAVANPGADDLDREIGRMEDKVAAGARFFQTQAVYDIDAFETFVRRTEHLGAALLAGVIPVRSARMAEHLNATVPGVSVPRRVIERVARASDPEEEGIAVAAELVRALRASADGVHLMALGRESLVPRIVEASAGG